MSVAEALARFTRWRHGSMERSSWSLTHFLRPEGFIEAFANIYLEAARAIGAETSGQRIPEGCDFPDIEDGVAGMAFVETAVESAANGGAWTKMKGT